MKVLSVLLFAVLIGLAGCSAIESGTKTNSIGMEFVKIPPGEFLMGSGKAENERPIHRVVISSAFWIGKYEVTQGQWESTMGSNPSSFVGCGKDCPVENVSWEDAKAFTAKLNAKNDGLVYSLPSEAQWEYAVRAGTTDDYYGPVKDIGWYANNSGRIYFDAETVPTNNYENYKQYNKLILENGGQSHSVGQKAANKFGIYDMTGNVWEWCEDIYNADGYNGQPADGSPNVSVGRPNVCVLRGGSWFSNGSTLRSSFRDGPESSSRRNDIGFRLLARPK